MDTTDTPKPWHIELPDMAATQALGRALGQALPAGAHLALVGEMGAGKTTLCRSIAEGMGVADLDSVTSPTYALVHSYPGTHGTLNHLDLYRLADLDAAMDLGLDEVLADGEAVAVVEWANHLPQLLDPQALWLTLAAAGPQAPERRQAALRGPEALIQAVRAAHARIAPPGPAGP